MARDRAAESNSGLWWVAGLGLGALAMYFGDPQLGRRRRALLRDQYAHAARKVQEGTDLVLRDASHRAAGAMATMRNRLEHRGEVPADAILVARVRSALGRATSHPHAVRVEASDGRVTLSGVALAAECEAMIACAQKVPGVTHVENRLELHETAEHIPALQGGTVREGMRAEPFQENWSPAFRSLAGALGAGLALAAWRRGGLGGFLMGAAGSGLLARAATNRDVASILGVGRACRGVVVQKSIHIDAPVQEVYGRWKVEDFPQWMTHVREVRALGNDMYHWVVDGPAGVPVEWDSHVTARAENCEMAWSSVPGSMVDTAGRVRFAEENGGTRVQVMLTYVPIGGLVGHAIAKALGSDPRSRMDDDLMRFKSMIETGRLPHDAAAHRQPTPALPASEVRH